MFRIAEKYVIGSDLCNLFSCVRSSPVGTHAKLIGDNGYPLLGVGFVRCFHFKGSHQVLGDRLQ